MQKYQEIITANNIRFSSTILILAIFMSSCNKFRNSKLETEVKIEAMTFLNTVQESKEKANPPILFKDEHFLIFGYNDRNLDLVDKKVDSLVCCILDTMNFLPYNSIIFEFYRWSNITNFENLKMYREDLYMHSLRNDRLISYHWDKNGLRLKEIFRLGSYEVIRREDNFSCFNTR